MTADLTTPRSGHARCSTRAPPRSPDRVALVHGDERITYARAARARGRAWPGRWPRAASSPATRWRSCCRTCRPSRSRFLAVLRAGAVVVPLNPAFKEAELEFHFRECGVRAIVADDRVGGVVRGDRLAHARPGGDRRCSRATLATRRGPAAGRTPASPDDDAVFQYSSGSTGRPKRVPRTHRHLRAEADAYVAATGMTRRRRGLLRDPAPPHLRHGLLPARGGAQRRDAGPLRRSQPVPAPARAGARAARARAGHDLPGRALHLPPAGRGARGGRPLVAAALLLGRRRAAALDLRRVPRAASACRCASSTAPPRPAA